MDVESVKALDVETPSWQKKETLEWLTPPKTVL